ncbi:OmpA family protein [Vibrio genomosp. F6]|uniref:OmpA family protein n=1 Tax=Vibrio genomosp. F6 TaxID=723172 RepID=UPI0010BDD891|nr:OmpA family protein [Vibrio genomosp. F6]TKF18928.1 OmpA family protein [Vibrio genomosp. F6]
MKYIAVFLGILLSGCSSMPTMYGGLLDAAPQHDGELLYPDRGVVSPTKKKHTVGGPQGQQRPSAYSSLESFLATRGIDYEVLPGNYVMVRLKNRIQFESGSSTVSSYSEQWLNELGSYLARQPGIDIVIDGHADNTGSNRLNDGLSESRAKQVKLSLMKQKVAMNSIYTRGYGEYVPACSNQSKVGKACNRRVELMLIVAN